jgi:chemotaxis protein methyltransferase CheR
MPPTFILFDTKNVHDSVLTKDLPFVCKTITQWPDKSSVDNLFVAEASTMLGKITTLAKTLPVSILVFGEVSTTLEPLIKDWKSSQVLLEDLGSKRNIKNVLKHLAHDTVPATSFAYMSSEFLGRKP